MITFKLQNEIHTISIPSLTFGAASFENISDEDTYMEFLDKYTELGGNCIDTARVYCSWLEDGDSVSETVIGNWMEKRNNRNNIIISTKGGHPDINEMSVSRLSSSDLKYDLKRSLECLKTDYIDIYFLHRDDPNIPVSEIMPILNEFVKDEKVHFLGASNWTTKRIQEANDYAAKHNLEPFKISQINYSLAHSSIDTFGDPTLVCMDTNEHRWYSRNQFPVMAFSPQAKGFFAKLAKGDSAKNLPEGQYTSTSNLARLAKVKTLSDKTGQSPAIIPFGYLSSQPFFVSSVFSVSKMWQLEENMTAQDLRYDKKTLAYLENLI